MTYGMTYTIIFDDGRKIRCKDYHSACAQIKNCKPCRFEVLGDHNEPNRAWFKSSSGDGVIVSDDTAGSW